MSENVIHFCPPGYARLSPCGRDLSSVRVTSSWPRVTCGACRLEMPMTKGPGNVEYRTPSNVTAVDTSLAEQDRCAARIAKVREVEKSAAQEVQRWKGVLADATRLREKLEADRIHGAVGVGGLQAFLDDLSVSEDGKREAQNTSFAQLIRDVRGDGGPGGMGLREARQIVLDRLHVEAVELVLALRPVRQGPIMHDFKDGERFMWTSGNGKLTRTGTVLVANEGGKRGKHFVEIDSIPYAGEGCRTWLYAGGMGYQCPIEPLAPSLPTLPTAAEVHDLSAEDAAKLARAMNKPGPY